MAVQILSQLAKDLNENINAHAELETLLLQAESIARVAESLDFSQFKPETLRHYFLSLLELVEKTTQLSGNLSQELCRIVSELQNQTEIK